MKNALILHGTFGSPRQNWFQWLEGKLSERGYKVWVPQLPHPELPNVRRYNKFIFSSEWEFNEESVLIGHSSGSVEILAILQNLPENIIVKQAVLVGAFRNDLGLPNLTGMFEEPFDFAKIKTKAKKFTFLHSDDDPFCPLPGAEYLAKELGGELTVIPGAKHFSVTTGGQRFKELPVILKLIGEA